MTAVIDRAAMLETEVMKASRVKMSDSMMFPI